MTQFLRLPGRQAVAEKDEVKGGIGEALEGLLGSGDDAHSKPPFSEKGVQGACRFLLGFEEENLALCRQVLEHGARASTSGARCELAVGNRGRPCRASHTLGL